LNFCFNSNNPSLEQSSDTIVATIPIWMQPNLPVAVAGIVYEMEFFKDYLFNDQVSIGRERFENVCNTKVDSNVTCYLLDEAGSILLTNDGSRSPAIGRPFYTENPWIMIELESDGFYDLIIPGRCCKLTCNYRVILVDFNLKCERKLEYLWVFFTMLLF
jgi:hypothetical protein